MLGTVIHFNAVKAYGFIAEVTPEKRPRQFFFHVSQIKPRVIPIDGDLVIFNLGLNPKPNRVGQLIAVDVRVVKRGDPEAATLIAGTEKVSA